jgi:large subunit ribosomal protein L9
LSKQDFDGLGRDGQVVSVKPGRARNHLVPGKYAAYATPERLLEAEIKRESWAVEESLDTGDTAAVTVSPFLFFGFSI